MLRDCIARRMDELGMSPSDLQEATGLTGPGLAPIRRGEIRNYQMRLKRPLCEALGWTTDSVDRMLSGKPPKRAVRPDGNGSRSLEGRVASLERAVEKALPQIAELAGDVKANLADLQALASRVSALERRRSVRPGA